MVFSRDLPVEPPWEVRDRRGKQYSDDARQCRSYAGRRADDPNDEGNSERDDCEDHASVAEERKARGDTKDDAGGSNARWRRSSPQQIYCDGRGDQQVGG